MIAEPADSSAFVGQVDNLGADGQSAQPGASPALACRAPGRQTRQRYSGLRSQR
jgi:hypothetical protein